MESLQTDTAEDWKQKRSKSPKPDVPIGPFELWLVHVETGRYLHMDGKSAAAGATKPEVLETRDDALALKDSVLDRVPWACVRLVDQATDDRETFTSPKLGDYTREKRRYLAWKSKGLFGRLLRKSPTLNIYDPALEGIHSPV